MDHLPEIQKKISWIHCTGSVLGFCFDACWIIRVMSLSSYGLMQSGLHRSRGQRLPLLVDPHAFIVEALEAVLFIEPYCPDVILVDFQHDMVQSHCYGSFQQLIKKDVAKALTLKFRDHSEIHQVVTGRVIDDLSVRTGNSVETKQQGKLRDITGVLHFLLNIRECQRDAVPILEYIVLDPHPITEIRSFVNWNDFDIFQDRDLWSLPHIQHDVHDAVVFCQTEPQSFQYLMIEWMIRGMVFEPGMG